MNTSFLLFVAQQHPLDGELAAAAWLGIFLEHLGPFLSVLERGTWGAASPERSYQSQLPWQAAV